MKRRTFFGIILAPLAAKLVPAKTTTQVGIDISDGSDCTAIAVFVNGVLIHEGFDYWSHGGSITFLAPQPAGSEIELRSYNFYYYRQSFDEVTTHLRPADILEMP